MILDKNTVTSQGQSGGITGQSVTIHNTYNTYNTVPEHVIAEVQDALTLTTSVKPYSILLCPPSQLSQDEQKTFEQLKQALIASDFQVHISEDLQNEGYRHLSEADFVLSGQCNSIIIFAKDILTLAQLNIYTFLKENKPLANLDIRVIQINFPEDEYFSQGCLQFIRDSGCIFSFQDIRTNGVDSIITYLSRRRQVSYLQARGRKQVK